MVHIIASSRQSPTNMCSLHSCLLSLPCTLAFSSPVSKRQRRQVWAGGMIPDDTRCKCHALPKEVSDYCGYNTTVLPNARGHTTVEKALGELGHFAPLLTDSPCSDHLGVLLCFHYFPFWGCAPDTVVECENRVAPCKDTCEAAKSESCTDFVNSQSASGWANHLDCDKHESFPIQGVTTIANSDTQYRVCANITGTIRKNFTKPACLVVTTEVRSTSTTPKPEVTSPTEAPTTKGIFYKPTIRLQLHNVVGTLIFLCI